MSAYWFKMRYQIYVDKCRRWKHIITTQLISVVTFYHKYLWYRKLKYPGIFPQNLSVYVSITKNNLIFLLLP